MTAKPGQLESASENSAAHSPGIFEVPGATPNFRTELAAQLAELVPEAVADGKLDIEKLRELLATDATDSVADGFERFGLFWPGKKRALRAAQAPTTATLKPDFAHSKDWDTTQNVFIEGDNLAVLKTLQRHYHNKIKLIYIDPPYNTGKDFVYPDNFKEGLDTYLEWTRQVNEEGKKVSNNSETEGRYHSNWLNMMYPRLKLARNLLTDDGVIFISIDDNEVDNLKKLCNEVFGEKNFIAQLVWKKKYTGGQHAKFYADFHEYILVFAKFSDAIGDFGVSRTDEDAEKFSEVDEFLESRGKYYTRPLKSNLEERKTLIYPITMPDGAVVETQWLVGKERFEREFAEKRIIFRRKKSGHWQVYKKYYQLDGGGKTKPPSLVDRFPNTEAKGEIKELFKVQEGRDNVFYTVKPVNLIKHLLEPFLETGDTCLDFFAGSASTAHAVMQLNAEDNGNRRFIMVQLPEPTPEDSEARKAGFKTIADISRKRIELAGEKIKADSPMTTQDLDTGFRAYKLADTNFAKWRVTSEVAVGELEQHLLALRNSADDAAQADDLLTELLLKLGYSLTEFIRTETIAGLEVRKVGDNEVLAYLNKHTKPTLEQLRALVDAVPARIIVLEDAFQGDDELKTNLAQHAKSRGIELRTA